MENKFIIAMFISTFESVEMQTFKYLLTFISRYNKKIDF